MCVCVCVRVCIKVHVTKIAHIFLFYNFRLKLSLNATDATFVTRFFARANNWVISISSPPAQTQTDCPHDRRGGHDYLRMRVAHQSSRVANLRRLFLPQQPWCSKTVSHLPPACSTDPLLRVWTQAAFNSSKLQFFSKSCQIKVNSLSYI